MILLSYLFLFRFETRRYKGACRMSATFQNGLCGCCNNKNVCLLGCCLPCYAMGKTAEVADQNCILFGLLALTPLNLCAGTYVRSLIREKYNIEVRE